MASKQHEQVICKSAVQCLRERKLEILERWESRARQELPSAAAKKHYMLLNSLPLFLDELVESLERRSPKLVAMKDIAQTHASQRASIADYSLQQVQDEYTILRQVIFEVIEEFADVTTRERNIILDFIVAGRGAASEEYLRLANAQIALGQEELALALESADMGSFSYDIQSGRMMWSETMMRLHGFSLGEFTGRLEDFWPHLLPEDRDAIQKAIHDCIQHHRDYSAEYRVTWPDGSIHWLLGKGRSYYDESGKPIRMRGTVLETTERKHSDDSLRRSYEAIRNEREWYEKVLNSIPTPVMLLNSETRAVFFKNEAIRKLKLTIPTVIPESGFPEFHAYDDQGKEIPPDQMPRHRVLRGETFQGFELCWETPEGTAYFHMDGKPLPAAFGHAAAGIVSFQDISPLKKVEEELRHSDAKFRILFESQLIGVVFGDVGGCMYELNDHFLNLIGYSREEVLRDKVTWVQLTPPEYLYLDEQALAEMKQKGYCAPYEKPFVRKDGSVIWVMLTAIFMDDKKFKHAAIVIDVTDRKRTRDALEKSESELRLINDSIPQIVWTAFADSSIEHYNQNWQRYTGLTEPIGPSQESEKVLHPDDVARTVAAWDEAQRTGVYVVEHRIRRKDGEFRWFLSRARPLRDDTGKIVRWFGTSTDIQDQKQIQQALEQERDLREQFVSTLTHDLRNPLSASKMNAQMIARHPDRADRIPRLASRITDSLERADKMIEDLLDANRIRAGKGLPIEVGECDLNEIANKVCDELIAVHGERFQRKMPNSVEGYWSCKDLYRLLENLLTNGIKYGFSDTPVTLKIYERGSEVVIEVHNMGEPIPPDDQKRLFDPFMRSRKVESSDRKGWGLGLTLVRGVTDAHGGHVEVQSDRDTGTTFRVTLPKDARNRDHRRRNS